MGCRFLLKSGTRSCYFQLRFFSCYFNLGLEFENQTKKKEKKPKSKNQKKKKKSNHSKLQNFKFQN